MVEEKTTNVNVIENNSADAYTFMHIFGSFGARSSVHFQTRGEEISFKNRSSLEISLSEKNKL